MAYLLISLAANSTVWSHGVTHSIQTSGGADVQEEVWFLGQFPWAVIHGINPLASSWLNFPFGLNLMDNGSMPLLGLIGAPITLLFGSLATFNVLVNLGYGLSAVAFFVMARRFVSWAPAAFIGGLLYGFSPFAVAEGSGHLFLIFDPIPPLVILVVDRTLRTKETSARNGGILLGLCLIAQFYISTEVFAGLVVMMALATLIVALWHIFWTRATFDFHLLARFAVSGICVLALGIGFGVWTALLGPHHIVGPAQTRVALAGISNDPLGWIVPTIDQHFTAGYAHLGDSLVAQRDAHWHVIIDDAAENGSYIGLSLLALLIVGGIWLRRRVLVKFCLVMASLAMLLSLGSRLHVDGRLTGIRLPFTVIAHLPLLESSAASRYVLFFWVFAALLLAVILAELHRSIGRSSRPWLRMSAGTTCGIVAAVALLPLIPAWPYSAGRVSSPRWFTGQARQLPVGSVVLVYPMADSSDSSAMVWQAAADFRFQMPGGYAVFRSPSGAASFSAPPSWVQTAMAQCGEGVTPSVSTSEVQQQLRAWRVNFVVVPQSARHWDCAAALFDSAVGNGVPTQGVLLWRIPSQS